MFLTQSRYDLVSFWISNTYKLLFPGKNYSSRILKRLAVAVYTYIAVVPKWKFVEQTELYHEKDTMYFSGICEIPKFTGEAARKTYFEINIICAFVYMRLYYKSFMNS